MGENIVRLATSRETPVKRACRDCRFYEPKREPFWGTGRRRWHLRMMPPFFGYTIEPTAEGHAQAICTAFGGFTAKIERQSEDTCGPDGAMFSPSPVAKG